MTFMEMASSFLMFSFVEGLLSCVGGLLSFGGGFLSDVKGLLSFGGGMRYFLK
jgi:hypothetical protein